MTQQEFENLTGMVVEPAVFERAERIYLNAGGCTKEEVCAEIKQYPWLLESETVKELAEMANANNRACGEYRRKIQDLKDTLLATCLKADDDATWRTAKDVIGTAAVITFKIDNDAELSRDDLAYIRENLR